MNYIKHYDRLIDRARNRILDGYGENHHVIPKCMGGSNEDINIVRLTAEEHYIAHQLLVKMNPPDVTDPYNGKNPLNIIHDKLVSAAVQMTRKSNSNKRINNKLYGWLKRRISKSKSVKMKGRIGPNRGWVPSEETRAKWRAIRKGRPAWNKVIPMTDDQKLNLSMKMKGKPGPNKGKPMSIESKAKLSAANLGKKRGPYKKKINIC